MESLTEKYLRTRGNVEQLRGYVVQVKEQRDIARNELDTLKKIVRPIQAAYDRLEDEVKKLGQAVLNLPDIAERDMKRRSCHYTHLLHIIDTVYADEDGDGDEEDPGRYAINQVREMLPHMDRQLKQMVEWVHRQASFVRQGKEVIAKRGSAQARLVQSMTPAEVMEKAKNSTGSDEQAAKAKEAIKYAEVVGYHTNKARLHIAQKLVADMVAEAKKTKSTIADLPKSAPK
ncbi:unnamed protein product [Vitrella brassicaformis CCMP3155]|uniref:Uncharacterized protein n=1 Tax=Vitrella brassicaformis (strain CCMP3155) TaxID=1169540 RepID=A0A0G4EXG6_VITBC|nr:unnamed protein product [Vitrella brassicaformis CCMP3155]|eukprot:CEM03274.1 unnamed protein product [Vitrella brassicaformis CCMP3155]